MRRYFRGSGSPAAGELPFGMRDGSVDRLHAVDLLACMFAYTCWTAIQTAFGFGAVKDAKKGKEMLYGRDGRVVIIDQYFYSYAGCRNLVDWAIFLSFWFRQPFINTANRNLAGPG